MKHWQQRERARQLLSKEVGYVRKLIRELRLRRRRSRVPWVYLVYHQHLRAPALLALSAKERRDVERR